MKLLFDTNVVLDLLMDREPFADAAAELFARVEAGSVIGCLCGTTITTVFYLVAKVLGHEKAKGEIAKLMALFEIAPVNRSVLETALASEFSDFEDAVLHEAARHFGADAIVTRNQRDFKNALISVYTPAELTGILSVTERQ